MPDEDHKEVKPGTVTAEATEKVAAVDENKPVVAAKKREYTHVPSDTTYELSDEDYADMKANPDRWTGLPCPMSGDAAPKRIGPDGEVVWTASKDKVDPYNMPTS